MHLARDNVVIPRVILLPTLDMASANERRRYNANSFNSLVPGRCSNKFKSVISKHMLRIMPMNTSSDIAFRWLLQITFDDKSAMG